MKKYFYFAIAAVAALASCSSDDATTEKGVAPMANEGINFGVYTPSVTRSTIETNETVKNNGFGVFAFSQMQEPINTYSKANYQPNFMYNQKVTFDGTAWTYAPIKYWPNNDGALVSFYAYAPYFDEFNQDKFTFTPESNDYSKENTTIDQKNVRLVLGYDAMGPAIEYTRSSIATEGVDLLWGAQKGITDPKAPVNLEKQKIDEKIEFVFKHAMSRLHFNVQVWGDEYSVNKPDVNNSNHEIDQNTTIKIKKVELVGNFWNTGTLRLYDGIWKHDKGDHSNLVFEEGAGHFSAAVEAGLKGTDAQKEIDLLVGTGMNADGTMLDDAQINNFVMVMPGTKFYIQITYDVITVDPTNPKNNSTVTNVVKTTDLNAVAENSDAGTYILEQGKAYNFHLNIGLTTVKFDAEVEDWDVITNEVALPENKN